MDSKEKSPSIFKRNVMERVKPISKYRAEIHKIQRIYFPILKVILALFVFGFVRTLVLVQENIVGSTFGQLRKINIY